MTFYFKINHTEHLLNCKNDVVYTENNLSSIMFCWYYVTTSVSHNKDVWEPLEEKKESSSLLNLLLTRKQYCF